MTNLNAKTCKRKTWIYNAYTSKLLFHMLIPLEVNFSCTKVRMQDQFFAEGIFKSKLLYLLFGMGFIFCWIQYLHAYHHCWKLFVQIQINSGLFLFKETKTNFGISLKPVSLNLRLWPQIRNLTSNTWNIIIMMYSEN